MTRGTSRRRKSAWLVALTLLAGAAAVTVPSARAVSRRYLFPVNELAATVAPSDAMAHVLVAKDGVRVHALELPAPAGARTVVYFHNNRETVESSMGFARALHARGFGVVLVEYRGYGESRGASPTEEGLYLDAEASLDMLRARGVAAERVVLLGVSLGSGVAAEMARRGHGARLVLVTPYTSIPDLVSAAAPAVPARAFVADHFDTLAKSSEIVVPTLVIHGDADEIVPFWMGERVTGAIAGARLVRVAGGHHGDLFAREGDRLMRELAPWVT